MFAYSRAKFQQLSEERKAQVLLKLIEQVELTWEDPQLKDKNLQEFWSAVAWLSSLEQKHWDPLMRWQGRDRRDDISLRQLLDLAVPLERFLKLSIKDPQILSRDRAIAKQDIQREPLFLVLDHLRSSFNVGSIFRSAECFGVSHLYLVGYTPSPMDPAVKKTAMGATELVSWSQHQKLSDVLQSLSQDGVKRVAVETAASSSSIYAQEFPKPCALIFGNERFGLGEEVLDLVDQRVHIPMLGAKNSLNVANAVSVVSSEVIRQWREAGA